MLEGGYLNFEKILPILKTYRIEDLKENFLLIGLVQNQKTVDAFISYLKNTIRYSIMGFDDEDFDVERYYNTIWRGFNNQRQRNENEMESIRKREGLVF